MEKRHLPADLNSTAPQCLVWWAAEQHVAVFTQAGSSLIDEQCPISKTQIYISNKMTGNGECLMWTSKRSFTAGVFCQDVSLISY